MDKFIKEIINNKTPCYFISPHLDDAALSAGGLISYLSGKVEVNVINVFTSCGDGKSTLSARKYLKQCGFDDAKELYKARVEEDRVAWSALEMNVHNLGYTEALWRKFRAPRNLRKNLGKFISEFNHVYPIYRLNINSGRISEEDRALKQEIAKKIKAIVGDRKNVLVFCPVGVGNHVDHLLVKKACEEAFNENVIYWSDFPYNVRANNFDQSKDGHQKFELQPEHDKKDRFTRNYRTQFQGLFPDGKLPFHKEVYSTGQSTEGIVICTKLDEKILKDWLTLWQNSPAANYANSPFWFISVIETFGFKDFKIIAQYYDNQLKAIVGLIKEKRYGIVCYTLPPGDFVYGTPFLMNFSDNELATAFLEKIIGIGTILFDNISEPLVNFFKENLFPINTVYTGPNFRLNFEKDSSGKILLENRKKLMYRVKNMEKKFEVKSFTGESLNALETVFKIDQLSRKQARGYSAFSSKVTRKFYMSLAKNFKEGFSINILYFENKPIAYRIGFVVNDTFFASQIAFIDEYARYSPGNVLLIKLIESMEVTPIKEIDFGSGDSYLKRSLSNINRPLYRVVISKELLPSSYIKFVYFFKDNLYNVMTQNMKVYSTYRNFRKAIKI